MPQVSAKRPTTVGSRCRLTMSLTRSTVSLVCTVLFFIHSPYAEVGVFLKDAAKKEKKTRAHYETLAPHDTLQRPCPDVSEHTKYNASQNRHCTLALKRTVDAHEIKLDHYSRKHHRFSTISPPLARVPLHHAKRHFLTSLPAKSSRDSVQTIQMVSTR